MIKDLADLKRFLVLCRKQGVRDVKFGDVSVVFGDLPREPAEADGEPETDGLTDEQAAFYSVTGVMPP